MKKTWQIVAMVAVLWTAGYVLGANSGPAMLDSATGRLRADQLTTHTHTGGTVDTATLTSTFVTTSALASTLTSYALVSSLTGYAAATHTHTTVAAMVPADSYTGARFLFDELSGTTAANTGNEPGVLSYATGTVVLRSPGSRKTAVWMGALSRLESGAGLWQYTTLTVSFWMRLGTLPVDLVNGRLVAYAFSAAWATPYYSWGVILSPTIFSAVIVTQANPRVDARADFPTGAVPLHQWVHVAMTDDGTNLRLYLDGVEVASNARTTAPIVYAPTGVLWVGSRWGAPSTESITFAMRDLRVENTVRSAAYLLDLYQRGAGMVDPIVRP